MLTKVEQDYYECMPHALDSIAVEIKKLREAVEKCTGRAMPPVQEEPVNEEQPKENQFDCLAVTNVQVFPFKEGINLGHMKGLASVVINDQLQLRGLRVMEGENGMFVGYPIDAFYKGEDCRSVCFPITKQLRKHIENCILEKYVEVTK